MPDKVGMEGLVKDADVFAIVHPLPVVPDELFVVVVNVNGHLSKFTPATGRINLYQTV